jgi:mitogen-activated protein kinase kinase
LIYQVIIANPAPDMKKQIARELKFSKLCVSDSICRYYGAFPDDRVGTINMAMEYCEGGSLDAVYKRTQHFGGRIGERALVPIVENLLQGLVYLHQHRIIHRDIKPSNILFSRDGKAKLCDFGVSGNIGPKGDAYTCIGTSYYMAPERICGQTYTITSDVWSLGITLLEVAYSRFPFPMDGKESQSRLALLDFFAYIVGEVVELKDEPNVYWSKELKSFVGYWYVIISPSFGLFSVIQSADLSIPSLEKRQDQRWTPWLLLKHPWITEGKQKKGNMTLFLQKVWGW